MSRESWAAYLLELDGLEVNDMDGGKTPPKKRRDPWHEPEFLLQCAVADYLNHRRLLWCHVPNEGKRSDGVRARLAKAGVKTGVPDVMIYSRPLSGAPGVALELKVGRNKPTKTQAEWLQALAAEGWSTHVAYTFDEVIEIITREYGP